jgi:hypothetical protein
VSAFEDSLDLRCRGCGRKFGLITSPTWGAYCCEVCMLQGPVDEHTERDHFIQVMSREMDLSALQIGIRFDLTRQRVSQVLKKDPLRS